MEINDITYAINGAIFEVNKVLGPDFLEKVYENALLYELKNRGLKAIGQAPINVIYKGQCVGEYFADIFVEDSVIIELKTAERIEKIHEAQLLNYLKATGIQVGLIVNFRHFKTEINPPGTRFARRQFMINHRHTQIDADFSSGRHERKKQFK